MSKNNIVVPEAKEALERFKMEAANAIDVQNHLYKRKSPKASYFNKALISSTLSNFSQGRLRSGLPR